jgi:purine-binding chemotaxis protein CheW
MMNIVTAKEVSQYLKLSESTLYKLAAKGDLRGIKIGGPWRFDRSEIQTVIRMEQQLTKQGEVKGMEELTRTMDQAVKTMTNREGKYLTFSLAGEEYGIGILKVKEIIGMMPITTVPRTPGFVKGVINLRGKVIPVVDLGLKFGMEEMAYTERTCIIVVEIKGQGGSVLIGIVVDSVSEVLNIKGNDIEDTPTFGTRLDTDYILGMAKMNGGVKILLHIDKVLAAEEIVLIEQAA